MAERVTRVVISGRVHGVGFRAWVEGAAHVHSLSGWVRNRHDGTVEAVFSGMSEDIDAMIADCRVGPRAALVERVEVTENPPPPKPGFRVMPTE
jgi:acylphosphatase